MDPYGSTVTAQFHGSRTESAPSMRTDNELPSSTHIIGDTSSTAGDDRHAHDRHAVDEERAEP